MCCTLGFSQSINFDQLGKEKWLRYNGGVSANAVYYDGTANRQALTYYLTGSLNFNIAGVYNIPLSFTYSNQEFNFPNPFNFNRLSLHPSYKWATAHIGDVSMTFSPYTLAGHQFSGAGFDLNPEGKFQISAMYGRFLKATEYNEEHPEALTAYKRMGYGVKTAYDFDFMKLGLILFKANDEENSIKTPFPLELGLSPKDNAVLSFESEFRLFEKASMHIEYAISGVTEDTRLTEVPSSTGLLSFLLKENISTQYYKALNASFDYPAGNGTLGLGYERIDPEYKTLGAYYFNNDLENITVNASQSIFDNKLNLSVNAGLQRDNLNKAKSSDQQRIVSAVNANYTASDRLGFNASYSNFQSYTNIRDQFDYINQVGAYDNIDTLNYRQISQNANLGINYILKKTETKQHSTNLNLVYQNSTNQQEGETIEGGENSFYNGMAGYTLGYPKQALNISLAANVSYNTVAEDDNMTLGPTLSIGKQFFDKQLRTNFSSSYNTSFANGEQQNNVFNFRLGSNYTLYKKHNLSLNFLMLFRNSELNTGRDLTITFGYSYAFDNFKLDLDRNRRSLNEGNPRNRESILSFRYRNVSYSGTIPELNEQLTNVYESSQFANIPQFKKDELKILLATVKEQKREEKYKEQALIFLEELYAFNDFQTIYDDALYNVVMSIKDDMKKIDMALEKLFVVKKLEADKHPLNGKAPEDYTNKDKALVPRYEALLEERETRLQKLVGHRWMETQFAEFTSKEVIMKGTGFLQEFKQNKALKAFELYETTENQEKLEYYLENEIIDFYYKKSLKTVNPELFELRYINKQ
ncbi:hypothetical protein SAMN05421766_101568 [Zobellia uliginosa]|uniref:Outer membrane protein beta-barrel family protein n=1 Tax=Zobellia uliginosa TaxID=143224 RepID=A0ABY1KJ10_9FLAO|nr:hypothetical protein [Zobellia uliginosa]SIS40286.1 hypothetical protein SAMN05421766_101568 [Zobellia uliginosa]